MKIEVKYIEEKVVNIETDNITWLDFWYNSYEDIPKEDLSYVIKEFFNNYNDDYFNVVENVILVKDIKEEKWIEKKR